MSPPRPRIKERRLSKVGSSDCLGRVSTGEPLDERRYSKIRSAIKGAINLVPLETPRGVGR